MATTKKRSGVDWTAFGFVRVAAVAPVVHLADPLSNAAEIADRAHAAATDDAAIIAFPELALTGYSCEDLFLTSDLQRRTEHAIAELCKATAQLSCVLVVGAPLQTFDGRRYNTALVVQGGQVRGAVPKTHLPNAGEFYERRWFTPGATVDATVEVPGLAPFRLCARQIFRTGAVALGVEICEDVWAPEPPSGRLALAGANIIVNPSASNELVAKAEYRRSLVSQQSARTNTAYVYAGSGPTESTKDVVFGGHLLIAENGTIAAEGERFALGGSAIAYDVDVDRLINERGRNVTWSTATFAPLAPGDLIELGPLAPLTRLRRAIDQHPFVPNDPATVDARAGEILAIQSTGLARRLVAARSQRAVIGVSGGLDSTLALLVAVEAMALLDRGPEMIVGITMPGPGTTSRTRSAADELMERLGVTSRTIAIDTAVAQHFNDIGHDSNDHSVVFENAQARERTQILFDVANQVGGIVVGTGDLSELALGWCTYNADHMSNYGVNSSVPKTLVRHLVRWYARTRCDEAVSGVLLTIADTPVSPELLPPDVDGNIVQDTEALIGPYELHDFFLWHILRNGYAPAKIRALANIGFASTYDSTTIARWLTVFLDRFHRQQFKRTTLPPGPKVGSVSVSPRGDLRMPDEVNPPVWFAL